jgi:glycosyltransferase involved in cell wall biosynthesis
MKVVAIKLAIVIPAKDEAVTIVKVLTEVKQCCDCDIIVVDDASEDNTAQLAIEYGAMVLPQIQSQGAWLATQAGIRYARKNDYDMVITMDGDGQHRAMDISLLVAAAKDDGDVVVGACIERGSFSRRIAWTLFKKLTGINIFDLTSGFRLYKKPAMAVLSSRQASLLEYQDMGVLLMLRSAGLNIKEVPVEMRLREAGISRIFSSWGKVGYYMFITLFLCLVKAVPEKSSSFTNRLKQGL